MSQENLGERLGVSRQAIYKWESDSSLPEIEKLIALSKIFSVTVGWLLGVEEGTASPSDGRLTEEQLDMVQEIVDRYTAAQPKGPSPRRRRIFKLAVGAAALCLVCVLYALSSKLDRVTRNYDDLQHSINNISNSVNSQIGSITSRVEDILKSQNDLTADWSVQLLSTDPAANTATFGLRAVPKTYVAGMTALFVAESGGERTELPVDPGADRAFSGDLTCPLTDSISLSVVFLTGEQRQTQWLEDYTMLYSTSFPDISVNAWPLHWEVEDGILPAEYKKITISLWDYETGKSINWISSLEQIPSARAFKVGLFRDQELVCWYRQEADTILVDGAEQVLLCWVQPEDVALDKDHIYQVAGILTDIYGRQAVYPDHPIQWDGEEWDSANAYEEDIAPANWIN